MLNEKHLSLCNILLSFSDAIDLVNESIAAHQMRTAFIAWEMTKVAKTPQKTSEKVFIGALLHDVGALTTQDKTRLHDFEENDLDQHCIRGSHLFNSCPLLMHSAEIVRHHHRPWSNWNVSIDADDVFGAQLLCLADYLERFILRNQYILHQSEELIARITSMAGTVLHKDVVDLFIQVSKREEFWLDLVSPRLYSTLLRHGPLRRSFIEIEELASIGAFFRSIIDFKSSFTATHSAGVAKCASALAKLFGLTVKEVSHIALAGDFHDIGKLAVPNAILDKAGKLTKDEFAVMKQHTYFTYTVLNSIGGLEQIAEWAAFHHEKLDGSGYPFHLNDDKISTGSRIMAVADIFTALTEDRPYRPRMEHDRVKEILHKMSNKNKIDKTIVDILFENYEDVFAQVNENQSAAIAKYNDFVASSD